MARRRGTSDAKAWKDIWGRGQGIGAVDAVVPARDLLAQLSAEYAAAHLLATEGPRGFTVRGVAAAAGSSTIAAYHYFRDKQGLIDAVYVEGHRRLRSAQDAQRFSDDPERDVRTACLAYREIAVMRRWVPRAPLRVDPESAAYTIWAAGHGMVMLGLTGNGPHEDRSARYDTLIDTLMRGLTV